ncbi:hypothetical protein [Corynebacterium variabile]
MSSEGWDDSHSESTRAAQIEQDVFGRDASGGSSCWSPRDNPDTDLSSEEVRTDFTRQLNAISLLPPGPGPPDPPTTSTASRPS